jgi:hypothetical protein
MSPAGSRSAPPFAAAGHARRLLQVRDSGRDGGLLARFDLRPDRSVRLRPERRHRLGRGKRQVPSGLPVVVARVLHQGALSVRGKAAEQVAERLRLHPARQAERLRALSQPLSGRLAALQVIVFAGERQVVRALPARHRADR